MSKSKKAAHIRRGKKARAKIKLLNVPRLCVYRTNMHISAQIISPDGASVLASASSVGKVFKQANEKTGNSKAASVVGKLIAECASQAGIKKVAFDRSGCKYHGRVKALAEAAREGGLEF